MVVSPVQEAKPGQPTDVMSKTARLLLRDTVLVQHLTALERTIGSNVLARSGRYKPSDLKYSTLTGTPPTGSFTSVVVESAAFSGETWTPCYKRNELITVIPCSDSFAPFAVAME